MSSCERQLDGKPVVMAMDGSMEPGNFSVVSNIKLPKIDVYAGAKVVKVQRASLMDGSMTEQEMTVIPPFPIFKVKNEK